MNIINIIKCKLIGHNKISVFDNGLRGMVIDSKCARCGEEFYKTPTQWLIDRYHSDKYWHNKKQ